MLSKLRVVLPREDQTTDVGGQGVTVVWTESLVERARVSIHVQKAHLFMNGAGTKQQRVCKCVGQGLGSGSFRPAMLQGGTLRALYTHLALWVVIRVYFSR